MFCSAYGDGVYGKCLWFRVYGYGLHFKIHNSRLTFSERYGYAKYTVLLGIRMRALRPARPHDPGIEE
jgi:hypothetical protein